jgi:hypothetical protein
MPGLDPGIHHVSKKIDCRVNPGNDEKGRLQWAATLSALLLPHQVSEAPEQIMRVARAG